MDRTIDYYMALPYTIELINTPGEGWFVRVRELPGCMSQGDTAEEALEMIQDAMRGWLEVSIEYGDPIPEPRSEEDYSGKFVVRVPRTLHRDLVETAEREGVSLNQFINVALAEAVGRSKPPGGKLEGYDRAESRSTFELFLQKLEGVMQRFELFVPVTGQRSGVSQAVHEPSTAYAKGDADQGATLSAPDESDPGQDASGS